MLTENLIGSDSRKSILEDDDDEVGVQAKDVEEEELKIESTIHQPKRGRSMYKRSPLPFLVEDEKLRKVVTKKDKEKEAEKARMLEIAAEV